MKRIVVSFKADNEQRDLLTSIFKDTAEIFFLKDFNSKEINDILKKSSILFSWIPDKELKEANRESLNNLEFVQLLSAGHNHVDFNMFPAGCRISNNKGAYAEPMAEHILAMILSFYKNLFVNHIKLSKGEFDHKTVNKLLRGSVCGILGFGGIGKAAARLLSAFGVKILAINSSGKTGDEVEFIGTLKDLKYVLNNSDIVVISLPLNNETNGLINKAKLELMKQDAVLINVARGEIINEKDLYEHLKSNPDFSAGIDAWWVEPFLEGEFKIEYPFFDLPNFLGSPHNSAIVPGVFLEGTRKAAQKILKYIHGEKVEFVNK